MAVITNTVLRNTLLRNTLLRNTVARNLGAATPPPEPEPTPDTFILPRRQVLHPVLATSYKAGTSWGGDTDRVFGGRFAVSSSSISAGDTYLGWQKLALGSGSGLKRIKYLGLCWNSGDSAVQIWVNGSDTGGRLNVYNGSTVNNQIRVADFTADLSGGATLELRASQNSVGISPQQFEVIDLASGTQYGTGIDSLPWFGDAPPVFATCEYWNGSAWVQHTPAPVQDTAAMWGSYVPLGHANQWRATIRFWSPQGTHSLNLRHRNSTAGGTITATLNGAATTPGTFSTSAGSTTYNNSTNLTYTASTTGMQTLVLSGSGGVACSVQWISWRKSSALGAITPTGTTYGVESLELYPWFADANSGFSELSINSSSLHYAYLSCADSPVGSSLSWGTGIRPGQYQVSDLTHKSSNHGVGTWSEGANEVDIDFRSGSVQWNQKSVANLQLAGSEIAVSLDDKASNSSGYRNSRVITRLTRTGA